MAKHERLHTNGQEYNLMPRLERVLYAVNFLTQIWVYPKSVTHAFTCRSHFIKVWTMRYMALGVNIKVFYLVQYSTALRPVLLSSLNV